MTLLINYYLDKNGERQNEINYCLEQNINNKLIKNIVILYNSDIDIPYHGKLIPIKIYGKPSYNNFFTCANEFSGIKILANSDIYFDNTLSFANTINDDEIFALCRWDDTKEGLKFYDKFDSQDVWIWRRKIVIDCKFTLGIPGCDNAILYKFQENNYNILSPSKTIKSIHYHKSNVRNYTNSDNKNLYIINEPYSYLKEFY